MNEKFDIIFLDPPYKEMRINNLIEKILENKILNPDGIIIIHRHKKDRVEITDKIKILDHVITDYRRFILLIKFLPKFFWSLFL